MDITRTPKSPRIIVCPVCDSEGATLHHDPRATLVYSCPHCLHEWQVNPDEELIIELEQATTQPAIVPITASRTAHKPSHGPAVAAENRGRRPVQG